MDKDKFSPKGVAVVVNEDTGKKYIYISDLADGIERYAKLQRTMDARRACQAIVVGLIEIINYNG